MSDQDHQQAAAPAHKSRRWIPALFAALIVLGLWGPNLLRPPPPAWTLYSSTKGQIRRVLLADKSVMRLNGASSVRVVFEDEDRRAALGQAEAAFLVFPSTKRPFLISSGDREVKLHIGELNIVRQTIKGGATANVLTVRRGQAQVYPVGHPEAAVTVAAGQQASWTDGQPQATVRTVNANNAFAWESRQLAYDHAPLSEVIADLNRYVARPIRLADPALAALPFSGQLTLEGEDAMLRKLELVLPVQDQPMAAEIVLRRLPPCGFKNCDKPKRRPIVQALLHPQKAPGSGGHLLPTARLAKPAAPPLSGGLPPSPPNLP